MGNATVYGKSQQEAILEATQEVAREGGGQVFVHEEHCTDWFAGDAECTCEPQVIDVPGAN